MKIAVCLSVALDGAVPQPGSVEHGVSWDSGRPVAANPADLEALEVALQLKDRSPECTVFALCAAPPGEAEGTLRSAHSVGADKVACVWDDGLNEMDTLLTARALAGAIRASGAGLVLSGDRRPDGDTGQVPYQVAELLGVPCVDRAISLAVAGDGVDVEQPAGPGLRRRLHVSLPAAVVIAPGGRTLRYPRTSDQLRAKSMAIDAVGLEDLPGVVEQIRGGPGIRVVRLGLPKPVRRDPLAAAMTMPLRERLRFVQGGGLSSRSGRVVPAEPADEAAREIVAFLKTAGLVSGDKPAGDRVAAEGASSGAAIPEKAPDSIDS